MYEKLFPYIEMSLLALKGNLEILAGDDVSFSQKMYVKNLQEQIDNIDEFLKEALVNVLN